MKDIFGLKVGLLFLLGFSSRGKPNLRAQSLRPIRPLYKREEETLILFFF